jgi:hypothetical protein
MILFANL